jgi:hypothetical protein
VYQQVPEIAGGTEVRLGQASGRACFELKKVVSSQYRHGHRKREIISRDGSRHRPLVRCAGEAKVPALRPFLRMLAEDRSGNRSFAGQHKYELHNAALAESARRIGEKPGED